jgi:hypothetical protein
VKCSNCGNENLESSQYCEYCGKRLHIETLRCPQCDAVIGDAKFCPNCGTEFRPAGECKVGEKPRCPNCGSDKFDKFHGFCEQCGFWADSAEPSGNQRSSNLTGAQVDYLTKKKAAHTAGSVVGGVASAAGIGFGIFKLLTGLIVIVLGIAALVGLPCMGLFIGIPLIIGGIFLSVIGGTAIAAGVAAGGAAAYSAKKSGDISDKLKGV